MPFVFVPHGRQPLEFRASAVGGCAFLVWEFPDGDWCYLDHLWHWQWRHKLGGVVALWWAGD